MGLVKSLTEKLVDLLDHVGSHVARLIQDAARMPDDYGHGDEEQQGRDAQEDDEVCKDVAFH
jgi:hypothetical protein